LKEDLSDSKVGSGAEGSGVALLTVGDQPGFVQLRARVRASSGAELWDSSCCIG